MEVSIREVPIECQRRSSGRVRQSGGAFRDPNALAHTTAMQYYDAKVGDNEQDIRNKAMMEVELC